MNHKPVNRKSVSGGAELTRPTSQGSAWREKIRSKDETARRHDPQLASHLVPHIQVPIPVVLD